MQSLSLSQLWWVMSQLQPVIFAAAAVVVAVWLLWQSQLRRSLCCCCTAIVAGAVVDVAVIIAVALVVAVAVVIVVNVLHCGGHFTTGLDCAPALRPPQPPIFYNQPYEAVSCLWPSPPCQRHDCCQW